MFWVILAIILIIGLIFGISGVVNFVYTLLGLFILFFVTMVVLIIYLVIKFAGLTQGAMNCATTNRTAFKKHAYFQGTYVCSKAIHRLSA